jgi:hypothetical protein
MATAIMQAMPSFVLFMHVVSLNDADALPVFDG